MFGIVNTIFVVLIFDKQSTKLFKMCKAEFPRKLFSSLNCIQNLLNGFKIHSVEVDFIYWELWPRGKLSLKTLKRLEKIGNDFSSFSVLHSMQKQWNTYKRTEMDWKRLKRMGERFSVVIFPLTAIQFQMKRMLAIHRIAHQMHILLNWLVFMMHFSFNFNAQ